MENKLAALIKNYPPETPILAAVSGGADSTAMLNALCDQNIPKGNLHCLHVNHGIRPENECSADADFVIALCEKLKIDCIVVVIPQGKIASFARREGIGIEAAARHFRHRALSRRAKEFGANTRICIAHTQDDLLETLLMRILRGAGPQGLSPMKFEGKRIIRPLLDTTRAEVLEYLKEKNISWREDSSNSEINYLRNKIRHNLIPVLNKDFPGWKTGLLNMSQTQSLTAAFIKQEVEKQIIWKFQEEQSANISLSTNIPKDNSNYPLSHTPRNPDGNSTPSPPHSPLPTPHFLIPSFNSLSTPAQNFFSHPQLLREESIFLAIDKLLSGQKNFKSVKRAAVRKFCKGGLNAADLGLVRVSKTADNIQIYLKKKAVYENGFSLLIKEPGFYTLKNITIKVCPYADQDKGGFCTALPVAITGSYSGSKKSLVIHGMPHEADAGQMSYLVTMNTRSKNA